MTSTVFEVQRVAVMGATKKTTVRVRRNPSRAGRAPVGASAACEPLAAPAPPVKKQIKKKATTRSKKNRNVDEYRAKLLKVKSALVAGFKNYMIRNGRFKCERTKGRRGFENISVEHKSNKVGVYIYDPDVADDMKVTLADITMNVPSSQADDLGEGIITIFRNISVRVRDASQTQGRVQVNIHPAFTAFVTVDGVGRTFEIRHTEVIPK